MLNASDSKHLEKQQMRTKISGILREISKQHTSELSSEVCKLITTTSELSQKNHVIAVFSAHGSELNLSSLHDLLPNKQLCYPRCLPDQQLAFHIVSSPQTMTPGTWGISEPDPDIHSEVDTAEIDLFLCPGLAFGRDGSRLGHGAGYYDRALENKSCTAQAWGIGMDMQVFDSVPSEPHDQRLDGVITESGIIPSIRD